MSLINKLSIANFWSLTRFRFDVRRGGRPRGIVSVNRDDSVDYLVDPSGQSVVYPSPMVASRESTDQARD